VAIPFLEFTFGQKQMEANTFWHASVLLQCRVTMYESMELLTGISVGQPDKDGRYLEGTINDTRAGIRIGQPQRAQVMAEETWSLP
jgi:hypothetical protein